MEHGKKSLCGRVGLLAVLLGLAVASGAWALEPKDSPSYLDQKEFWKPELYISSSQEPVEKILVRLPNQAAWKGYLERATEKAAAGEAVLPRAFIDPRSGAATSLMGAFPLIPGKGVGNRLTIEEVNARLGRPLHEKAGAQTVIDAVLAFVRDNSGLLGIDLEQLGGIRAVDVSPELWQVRIPQTYRGVPVRYGHLVASINNGNLVVIGTETWGNVRGVSTNPKITSTEAVTAGFTYAGGASAMDEMVRQPALEIIPVAPQKHQKANVFVGPVGEGYAHRLAWTFVFRRLPDDAMWEVIVDAQTGEVLAFQDTNHYVNHQITGGVYPVTATEICPTPGTCGLLQSGWPMPFADTGLASPNNFTNSAGIFDWTSGTVTTTLTGRYVDIVDSCGAVNNTSAVGSLGLGGVNAQHDCTTAGGSAGNTSASRTAFYEVNKIMEMARGWLPTNTWLQNRLTTNVNINLTCNGFWNGSSINFYRSGGGCRNTGELAGVFDHEWGHGMDDNDAGGALSSSSEAYADIAAIYRLQESCIGHGFFATTNKGCGMTADGTGFNQNEAQQGAAHCDLNCSGVRDADWNRHAGQTPDTALGFVCTSCLTGSGPCGRQVHCAAAPSRQAAWDFAARDLQSAPFNLDSQTAFIVANRVFYLGSGSIGSWHACTCGSSSSGCGSTNGYIQWLTADDDNGNLNDGTPHMTAIFNAFNRHGIACATPTPVNSGCSGGPTGAATLTGTGGNYQSSLSWNSVAGATRYWVFRSEGHAGCNFGKTKIAEVTGTSYVDTQVANGRSYSYNVVAVGSNAACFGPVSNCLTVTPAASTTPDFSVACSPSGLSVGQGGNGTSTCTVSSQNGFNSAVNLSCTGLPAGASCGFSANPVTPPANGSANSTLTVTVAGSQATGTFPFQVQGVSGALTRNASLSLTVTPPAPTNVFFDNFETDQGWTRNAGGTDTATTGLWERADPATTTSSGTKQLGTAFSGTNDLVTGPLAGAGAGDHDIDGGVTTIRSPAIALPATGTLTLSFAYYLAHGTNSSTADFLRVRVVGTTTSLVLEELGAANNDDAVWATTSINVSAFAGQTVRILIEAADASTASLVEAAVDDVRITQQ
ncbi:MAG TPA: endopeptidase [Thermoanaerobaculia bacterium]|nr:endopeptidase [Thermoanaerobaculia bacterium]